MQSAEGLKNLFWTEYMYSYDEHLHYVRGRMLKASKIANILPHEQDMHLTISANSQQIMRARKMLSHIIRESPKIEEKRRELYFDFEQELTRIDETVCDISLLLLQRFLASTRVRFYKKGTLKKIFRHFEIPPETLVVAGKFFGECLSVVYSKAFCEKYPSSVPIITAWPHVDYKYSLSKVIYIPSADVGKMCRWSSLAHEVCHSKLDDITRAFKTTDRSKKQVVEALLGSKWQDVEKRWSIVEEKIVKELKLRVGEAYRDAAFKLREEFAPPNNLMFGWQFSEMLCDIVTVKVCGPADIFWLGWSTAPHCRNPLLGMERHLFVPDHPPDMVRLGYEFATVMNDENGLGKNDKANRIKGFLEGIFGYDAEHGERKTSIDPRQEISMYLNRTYERTVLVFLKSDILPLADLILGDRPQFNRERWETVLEQYEHAKKTGKLGENLRPYDLSNMAWLRVWDIYEETIGQKGSYKDFWLHRHRARPFFEMLWNYLAKPKSEKIDP